MPEYTSAPSFTRVSINRQTTVLITLDHSFPVNSLYFNSIWFFSFFGCKSYYIHISKRQLPLSRILCTPWILSFCWRRKLKSPMLWAHAWNTRLFINTHCTLSLAKKSSPLKLQNFQNFKHLHEHLKRGNVGKGEGSLAVVILHSRTEPKSHSHTKMLIWLLCHWLSKQQGKDNTPFPVF